MTSFLRRLPAGAFAALLCFSGASPAQKPDEKTSDRLGEVEAEAVRHERAGDWVKALPLRQEALAVARGRFPEDVLPLTVRMNALGVSYYRLGEYAKAEAVWEESLRLREAKLGTDHPDVATPLNNLAELHRMLGRLERAGPMALRAVRIYESKLGPDHPFTATALHNLASLYWSSDQLARAETTFRRALAIRESRAGKDDPETAMTVEALGLVHWSAAEYDKAEPLLRRAVAMMEAKYGPDHPEVARALLSLATFCSDTNRFAEAEVVLRRALKITEAKFGPDHQFTGIACQNLGYLFSQRGEFERAEALYQRSLRITEKVFGPDHPFTAATLDSLANAYRVLGRSADAEPLSRRALAIRRAKLGADSPATAHNLGNLALICQALGRPGEAVALAREATRISAARLGPDHPSTVRHLDVVATSLALQDRWGEAAEAVDAALRRSRRYLAQQLSAMSETEQLSYLDERFAGRVCAAVAVAGADPAAGGPGRGAAWLLNAKALTAPVLAERVLLARDAADPALAAHAGQLREVRRELARLSFAPVKDGPGDDGAARLADLARREADLSRALGRAGPREAGSELWADLAAVRRALPRGSVLVEVARHQAFDLAVTDQRKRWKAPRYSAWVVPPAGGGDVAAVDLGEAGPIDAAVAALRRAVARAATRAAEAGEVTAEKEWHEAAGTLAGLVLRPLLPHAGRAAEWVVGPDGPLWQVPWAALPLPDGRYVAEAHAVRYLATGRDLLTPRAAVRAAGEAVVFAAPDFDVDAPAAADAGDFAALTRGVPVGGNLPRFSRLPGTAAEAEAVRPKLRAYVGAEPRLLLGKDATLEAYQALRRPRVLLLSTHGFFLPDVTTERAAAAADLPRPPGWRVRPVAPLTNPLLRCGLALAGANRRDGGGERGILTGMDVLAADLRGTELVVLSACETAVGDVNAGEGVAGLRQAFQLAGARSVLATLWQVPDRETAVLMVDFFDRLAKGSTKVEALRQAQLARIAERRRTVGAAHPFFWAAFTLTGPGD